MPIQKWLVPVFGLFVLFNLLDLSTTITALKIGLSEGNFALIFLANSLGLGLINFLILVKALFILGAGFLVLASLYTRSQNLKREVFAAILGFALLFAVVAGSNLVSILVSI